MSRSEIHSIGWRPEANEFRNWVIDLDPCSTPNIRDEPRWPCEDYVPDNDLPGIEAIDWPIRDQETIQTDTDSPDSVTELVESVSDVFVFANADNGRSADAAVIDEDIADAIITSDQSFGGSWFGSGIVEPVELDHGRDTGFAENDFSFFDEALLG